jgi:GMP synthase (glutamine-hydrolysing)
MTVVIINYGQTSSNRIASVLISLGVDYVVILPWQNIDFTPSHIILSGGPGHVYNRPTRNLPALINDTNIPVLGICYGMQLIAQYLGGTVEAMDKVEKGPVYVTELINNRQTRTVRWMNHLDLVKSLPDDLHITGVTALGHIAVFTDHEKWWAVQYHPESLMHRDVTVFERFLGLTPK